MSDWHEINISSDEDLQRFFDEADPDAEIYYKRIGNAIRYRQRGRQRQISNHEMRAVMIGLWKRLPQLDQMDFLKEILHYFDPQDAPAGFWDELREQYDVTESTLPLIADAIANAG